MPYIVYALFTVFIDKSSFEGSYKVAKAKWEQTPKYNYLHCIRYFKTN